MFDLDSYQLFCALEVLKSKQWQKSAANQDNKGESEIVCACAKYLEDTL